MQPTVPAWAWLPRERRTRTRSRDRDKYSFYGLRKDNRHLMRMEPLPPLSKNFLLNRHWQPPTVAPVTWRIDSFHGIDSWRLPDIKQSFQRYRPFEPAPVVLPASGAGSAGPADATQGWSHAARGWAAGALVLALLVLIVKAAESCLHKSFFKVIYMHTNVGAGEIARDMMRGHYHLHGVRRHNSEEWSTPNVTATSLQHHNIEGSQPHLDDSEAFSEPNYHNNDLPPPYSDCAQSNGASLKHDSEEPPPPYSACYVSYANPKDGIPTVAIHDRRLQILDECSQSTTEIDNVRNDLIENQLRTENVGVTSRSNYIEDNESGMSTELVFDSGRIIERVTINPNSNKDEPGVANNNNVSTSADILGRVTYIDENVLVHSKLEKV